MMHRARTRSQKVFLPEISMKKITHWTLALLLTLSSTLLPSAAKTPAAKPIGAVAAPAPAADSIVLLPASDVIAVLDVQRLVNDLLPKAKAAWPEQYAKFEKEFSAATSKATQAGVDIFKVKSLSIGLKLFGNKTSGAMIVDGIAASPEMLAQNSTVVEYKGKTLYIEKPAPKPPASVKAAPRPTRAKAAPKATRAKTAARRTTAKATAKDATDSSPLGNVTSAADNVSSLLKDNTAFVQLDAERLAVGDETEVKAVIDALTGGADPASSSELRAALQETNATGLFRFAAHIPESARQAASKEEFLKNLAVTRMVFGTLDVAEDLSLLLDARLRTGSAEEATKLHESLAALLGLGKMMLGGNQDPTMQMLNQLLDQIKINPQATDVALALTVPRALYETFLKSDALAAPTKSKK
jgi:hypothetical protein